MYTVDTQCTPDDADNSGVEDNDSGPKEDAHKLQEEGGDKEEIHDGGIQEGNREGKGFQL